MNPKTSNNLLKASVSLIGHFAAVGLIVGLVAIPFASTGLMGLVENGFNDPQTRGYLLTDLLQVIGLSALLWAAIFGVYKRAMRMRASTRRTLVVASRGSIATETLIIFPVFLLLTFGLGQMAVNSMAGLLTTLGTFEAARTLAVWGPEVGNNRTGTNVTNAIARDRGRIAAAAVIAPVAPMSAGNIACSKSNAFRKMVQGMVAAGLAPVESPQRYSTFASALDLGTYAQRGPAKFAGAYCSTTVNYSGDMRTTPGETSVGSFRTVVEYNHKMVFPLVGLAFGGTLSAGGWVTKITRTYDLTHHLTPNPELPKDNIL